MQDIGRLLDSLSKANELDVDAGSEENADDLPCEKPKLGMDAKNDTPGKAPVKANERVENASSKSRLKREEEDHQPVLPATRHDIEQKVKIKKEVNTLAAGTRVKAKRKVKK